MLLRSKVMRLITRSDFDGLACAVFLKEMGLIDGFTFTHPKDLQDGIVEVTSNDILANVPYVEGCHLWFDHHSSEYERLELEGKYKGASELKDSAAHVIYDYYGGKETFFRFDELLNAVNKVDSAKLTKEEILNPYNSPWVLLGFLMDPRTGLGRFHEFTMSNYQLMEHLVEWCRVMSIDEIMKLPDIQERIALYKSQTELFTEMLKKHSIADGDLIITDLRGVSPIYTGNRFLIYSLFPDQNISAWIVDGKGGKGCSLAVGHSVLNRTSKVDVGSLMLRYNGGGHKAVGTCQFNEEEMDKHLVDAIADLKELNK